MYARLEAVTPQFERSGVAHQSFETQIALFVAAMTSLAGGAAQGRAYAVMPPLYRRSGHARHSDTDGKRCT